MLDERGGWVLELVGGWDLLELVWWWGLLDGWIKEAMGGSTSCTSMGGFQHCGLGKNGIEDGVRPRRRLMVAEECGRCSGGWWLSGGIEVGGFSGDKHW